jgi:hypothetical protein
MLENYLQRGTVSPFIWVKVLHYHFGYQRSYIPATLSFSQQRLWIIHQLVPGIPFYNLPSAQRIIGNLNIPVFERCLDEILRRHESLRTVFPRSTTGNEEPVQVILPELKIKVGYVNLSRLSPTEQEPEILAHAGEEAMTPFDLEKGPLQRAMMEVTRLHALLRVCVLKRGERTYQYFFTGDYTRIDGWSALQIMVDVLTCYAALAAGREFQSVADDHYKYYMHFLLRNSLS